MHTSLNWNYVGWSMLWLAAVASLTVIVQTATSKESDKPTLVLSHTNKSNQLFLSLLNTGNISPEFLPSEKLFSLLIPHINLTVILLVY